MPYHIGKSSSCPSSKPHAVIKDSDGKVMGCHATQDDAAKQIAAIHASEGASVTQSVDLAASPVITGDSYASAGGTAWSGIIAFEGEPTGDGRMFSENAITWAEMPLPLRWNIEESHGGTPMTKAVRVGNIEQVWRDATNPLIIRGSGHFDDAAGDNEYAVQAARRMRDNFLNGISIDPDDISDSDVELIFPEGDGEDDEMAMFFAAPELTIFHAGRVRGATLCDIPAFKDAQVFVDQSTDAPAQVAAASEHFGTLSDDFWSGPTQERRLPAKMTIRQAQSVFAHVDSGQSATIGKIGARFLHHEVHDDGAAGHANLTACASGLRAINAGRARGMSIEDRRAAYEHMSHHLRAAGLTPPPYEGDEIVLTAGSAFPERPPAEWFADPKFNALTPLTIDENGRVYGHGAAWGTCHTSFVDTCTTPPREPSGEHAYYRLGEVLCADGSRVAVGSITLGTGHAPIRSITSSQAAEHYDNTGTAVALVASGEDQFGIWVAGAIRTGTPEARVAELRGAALSGDWRRIGGALRLVAFLAVNRPGFPIPRTSAFTSKSAQLSLVAAGIVSQSARVIERPNIDAAMQRIAKTIGRDRASKMAALQTRMGR